MSLVLMAPLLIAPVVAAEGVEAAVAMGFPMAGITGGMGIVMGFALAAAAAAAAGSVIIVEGLGI